jgi:hypothetical protein
MNKTRSNTQHIPEQELVAYVFGDSPQNANIATHVEACEQCSAELAKLRAVLNAINEETVPVPERTQYGEQIWASVRPRLNGPERAGFLAWLRPQRLALAGGVLALLIVAFVAGRMSKPVVPTPTVATNQSTPNKPERLARAAVAEHLERSQMMLVELANADASTDALDISAEQARARDLLEANRLIRQTAKRGGDPAVSAVLDELERVLLEIANSPSDLSRQRLAELQQQIQDQGILFKVRVVGSKVKKEREPSQQPKGTQRSL